MHCPRCGQKQVSVEIKFCSRCGFPLGLVSEILAHGGFLPQLADLYKQSSRFTRNNGLKFSLIWFLFWCFFATPVLAILGGDEIVALTAVVGFTGGLVMLVLSFLFLKNPPKEFPPQSVALPKTDIHNIQSANAGALPPPQSIPVDNYAPPSGSWKAPNTGELAQPPSIVEDTTKLLQKDK